MALNLVDGAQRARALATGSGISATIRYRASALSSIAVASRKQGSAIRPDYAGKGRLLTPGNPPPTSEVYWIIPPDVAIYELRMTMHAPKRARYARRLPRRRCPMAPGGRGCRCRPQHRAERVQHRGVLDGGGNPRVASVRDAAQDLAKDLAGPGLGQRVDDIDLPDASNRADLVADQLHQFGAEPRPVGGVGRHVGVQHHQPARDPPLHGVNNTENCAIGDIRVRGQHILHAAGGELVT